MGAKTKLWGPHAWVFLEGLSKLADEFPELMDLFVEIALLLPVVIPCIYCRKSAAGFTASGGDADPYRFISQPKGAQRFVHRLHNRVNEKLRDQEPDLQKRAEWHIPTFEEVLAEGRFKAVSHPQWITHFMAFVTYIWCDWREEDAVQIYRFIDLVCVMLIRSQLVKWARTLGEAWHRTKAVRERLMKTLSGRMELWFGVQRKVKNVMKHSSSERITPVTLMEYCQENVIVGCKLKT